MKKWAALAVCFLCIVVIAVLFFSFSAADTSPENEQEQKNEQGFGMFSWHKGVIAQEEAEALAKCIREADVSTIYQEFSRELLEEEDGEVQEFVARMKQESVEVYALIGDSEWAYDSEGEILIEHMQPVAEYNSRQEEDAKIRGIMVDVEPYLLEEWDEGKEARKELMHDYLSCIRNAYTYALQNQLKFLVCIPTFYDSTNNEVLEKLISRGCDGIAVMNYNRTDEYGQMAKEVGYAREYEKEIICIYELQQAGRHGLEEINTYAEEGYEALRQSSERLQKQFGYGKLQFAYHYYEPLQELLAEEF